MVVPDDKPAAVFPLSRTLFVAGALELAVNRIIVESLRPPPGQTASKLLVVLDWAGLYIFYFAAVLAAVALFWRGFLARGNGAAPHKVGVAQIILGATAAAGIILVVMPTLPVAVMALRAMAVLALGCGVVTAWRDHRPRRAALGITAWAAALASPLVLVLFSAHLGEDAVLRAHHYLLGFMPLLALLTPVLFAPRPLSIVMRRGGPWMLAILSALVIYTSIDEQPVTSAQMFRTAFGIDLSEGVVSSRLLVGALAVGSFMWALGACAISDVRAHRDSAVGLGLIMMGGFNLPWPLYMLLGVAGIWLLVDAAPHAHEEPIVQPRRVTSASLLMLAAIGAGTFTLACSKPTATSGAKAPSTAVVATPSLPATEGTTPPTSASPAAPSWLSDEELARLTRAAEAISAAATADTTAWQRLAYLTDRIGPRLSGSPQLAASISWAKSTLEQDGLQVTLQPATVRHWVRGTESGSILAPTPTPLAVLGLGGTVSTPKRGVTANVVVVDSWDALAAAKSRVKGAIVLYNVPLGGENTYGKVFGFRYHGASRAAELGAAAVMIRSLTERSLKTPHTGTLNYKEGVAKIPAAAISIEDADLIARLDASGQTVKVTLNLQSRELPPAPSYNVIAELRGHSAPHEIVLISAHIDSWDVGQGAHDDAGGVVACMQALATIKRLGLTPRRTIRVVLFTNEENGTAGADAYAVAEQANAGNHVVAFETDAGTFAPRGFFIEASKFQAPAVMARWLALGPIFNLVGAPKVSPGFAGTDVAPLIEMGVLGASIDSANEAYFDYHHTAADTLDKIAPLDFTNNIRAIAVMAYVLADTPARIDAP